MASDPRAVLERAVTVAVVGCSTHPYKPSHHVPAWLQDMGYRIVPVNPHAEEILGERVYRRLADLPEEPDLVVVFRPSAEAADVTRQAIARGARGVWLQLGITSGEARALAEEAGIDYVEDRCSGVDAETWGIVKEAS